MEELEAMTNKKRTEMAQNLGTAKVKKYNGGTERDDWDVFNEEQQSKRQHFSRQNVQTMHDNEVNMSVSISLFVSICQMICQCGARFMK